MKFVFEALGNCDEYFLHYYTCHFTYFQHFKVEIILVYEVLLKLNRTYGRGQVKLTFNDRL